MSIGNPAPHFPRRREGHNRSISDGNGLAGRLMRPRRPFRIPTPNLLKSLSLPDSLSHRHWATAASVSANIMWPRWRGMPVLSAASFDCARRVSVRGLGRRLFVAAFYWGRGSFLKMLAVMTVPARKHVSGLDAPGQSEFGLVIDAVGNPIFSLLDTRQWARLNLDAVRVVGHAIIPLHELIQFTSLASLHATICEGDISRGSRHGVSPFFRGMVCDWIAVVISDMRSFTLS